MTEVSSGDRIARCPKPLLWDITSLSIWLPLTRDEWESYAPTLCANLRITELEGYAYWDAAELYWEVELEEAEAPAFAHEDFGLGFAVEWQTAGEQDWTAGALQGESWGWNQGHYWEGEASPGRSTYRVAVSGVNAGLDGQFSFPCSGELNWAFIDFDSPTLEERAELEAEQEILIAEATRCAREAFVSNISPEALPVVEKYVDELIAEWMPQSQGPEANAELASYTMLMCAMGPGQGTGEIGYWAMMLLFGGF